MPEASMNEYDGAESRQDNVWPPWQIAPMQAEAITEGVNETPDGDLGFGVLAANAPHILAAAHRRKPIHAQS
jgi:hypothetical protein